MKALETATKKKNIIQTKIFISVYSFFFSINEL